MSHDHRLQMALGSRRQVTADWMPATAVGPLVQQDPALLWLEYHGADHGLVRSRPDHDLAGFLAEKASQFEEAWLREMAPAAPKICSQPYEVQGAERVELTAYLMRQGVPVIAQPALWWSVERIYGTPDLIVRSDWLRRHYPSLPIGADEPGHYVVLDLKFTASLESNRVAQRTYAAQVRIYAYMLGQLQGWMPHHGYLVTRDRLLHPIPVPVESRLDGPLDSDLTELREAFVDIKLNGQRYLPWQHPAVAVNLNNANPEWDAAKRTIAWERTPGIDPSVLPWVGLPERRDLAALGFPSLQSLLAVPPDQVPLERCGSLGPARCRRLRAILAANREGRPVLPPAELIPPRRRHEFFVDFEYLSNLNVDFQRQWPTLQGNEMIFMVGMGWQEVGHWRFRACTTPAESPQHERDILEAFLEFLHTQTRGVFQDPSQVILYHWSAAEAWQSRAVADRHGLPADHPLRHLPWFDLEAQVMRSGPAAIPGAWTYKLKHVARASPAGSPLRCPVAWGSGPGPARHGHGLAGLCCPASI